jgi:hypothetical protein
MLSVGDKIFVLTGGPKPVLRSTYSYHGISASKAWNCSALMLRQSERKSTYKRVADKVVNAKRIGCVRFVDDQQPASAAVHTHKPLSVNLRA